MEAALKSKGREPVTEICIWNDQLRRYRKEAGIPSAFDRKYEPKENEPLVFHFYGDTNTPQSIVLTEKDYNDFAINLNRTPEKDILPAVIRRELATSSLLFIGYGLEDLDFRTIQGVIGPALAPGDLREPSVIVLLPPKGAKNENTARQIRYLTLYAKELSQCSIYWGSVSSFCYELKNRWEIFYKDKQTEVLNDEKKIKEIIDTWKRKNEVDKTVFISYVPEDAKFAERLYKDLKIAGSIPLLYKEIESGLDWKIVVAQAIKSNRYFIPLFSSNSTKKTILQKKQQKQFKYAIDNFDSFPDPKAGGRKYIIPVRLDNCMIPYEKLTNIQYADLFPDWDKGVTTILLAMAQD